MSLGEHQGHSNWNQTVEFSSVSHRTKFDLNQFTCVLTHNDVKHTFHKITSAEFYPLNNTCAKYINHELQQTNRLWQKTAKSILKYERKWTPKFSYTTVNLNEGQGYPNWYKSVQLNGHYHTKFENLPVNVWIQANVKGFWAFFKRNYISTVLSFEYWMDKIKKWIWGSSHQQVSIIYNTLIHPIPLKLMVNFVR